MSFVISRIALGAILALALTACTEGSGGTPTPESTKGGSSSTAGTSTNDAKPRPAEYKLDDVDPCKLLTQDQMKQVKVSTATRNDSDVVKTGKVPTCDYRGNDLANTFGVAAVPNRGIDYWRGSGNVDAEDAEVSSFPAKKLALKGVKAQCAYAIDVADGQQLYVDTIPIGSNKPSQEEMCANVKKAAEFALATLQTLR